MAYGPAKNTAIKKPNFVTVAIFHLFLTHTIKLIQF